MTSSSNHNLETKKDDDNNLNKISALVKAGTGILENFTEIDQTKARIKLAIAATVGREVKNDPNKENLCKKKIKNGPLFATAVEKEVIKNLIEMKSMALSEEETEKLNRYYNDLKRSEELNFAIAALRYVEEKNESNAALENLSVSIMQHMSTLQRNDCLHLDYNHSGHAMRISIQKVEKGFAVRLFESSGVMDLVDKINPHDGLSIVSNIDMLVKQNKSLQHTGYEIFVPENKMVKDGVNYFINLFERASNKGRNIADLENKATIDAVQKKVATKLYSRLPILISKHEKFYKTLKRFEQISDESNQMCSMLAPQTKQFTNNCWAKRIQACQMHTLGKSLYKRVRLSTLQQQREILLVTLQKFMSERHKLPTKNQGIMQREKLIQDCQLIGNLGDLPTATYFKELFQRDKKSLELYTQKYVNTFGMAPREKEKIFHFASFEATKAILRVIDHSIAKLQTRRYLMNSTVQMTVPLSLNQASLLKMEDILKARVVTVYDEKELSKQYKVQIPLENKEIFLEPKIFLQLIAKNKEIVRDPEIFKIKRFLLLKIESSSPGYGRKLFHPHDEKIVEPIASLRDTKVDSIPSASPISSPSAAISEDKDTIEQEIIFHGTDSDDESIELMKVSHLKPKKEVSEPNQLANQDIKIEAIHRQSIISDSENILNELALLPKEISEVMKAVVAHNPNPRDVIVILLAEERVINDLQMSSDVKKTIKRLQEHYHLNFDPAKDCQNKNLFLAAIKLLKYFSLNQKNMKYTDEINMARHFAHLLAKVSISPNWQDEMSSILIAIDDIHQNKKLDSTFRDIASSILIEFDPKKVAVLSKKLVDSFICDKYPLDDVPKHFQLENYSAVTRNERLQFISKFIKNEISKLTESADIKSYTDSLIALIQKRKTGNKLKSKELNAERLQRDNFNNFTNEIQKIIAELNSDAKVIQADKRPQPEIKSDAKDVIKEKQQKILVEFEREIRKSYPVHGESSFFHTRQWSVNSIRHLPDKLENLDDFLIILQAEKEAIKKGKFSDGLTNAVAKFDAEFTSRLTILEKLKNKDYFDYSVELLHKIVAEKETAKIWKKPIEVHAVRTIAHKLAQLSIKPDNQSLMKEIVEAIIIVGNSQKELRDTLFKIGKHLAGRCISKPHEFEELIQDKTEFCSLLIGSSG